MQEEESSVFLEVLEHLGKEWEKNYRPEDVGLELKNILVLRAVNTLVTGETSEITAQLLRDRSPTFVRVYSEVMLRDIEEFIPNGVEYHEGRHTS